MPIEMLTALIVFASAMAFTPGPNNIMVTASTDPRHARIFNIAIALLLVASIAPMVF